MNTNDIIIRSYVSGNFWQQPLVLGAPVSNAGPLEVYVRNYKRDRWMPLETFLTIRESINGYIGTVERVRYTNKDGKRAESFAKVWDTWDAESETWRCQCLGAGASGSLTLWRRPIVRFDQLKGE